MKKIVTFGFVVSILFLLILIYGYQLSRTQTDSPQETNKPPKTQKSIDPLSVEATKQQVFPGSNITIESTLFAGINYKRYYASYISEGLKIFGLLTVPTDAPPAGGYPAIIFNHGYIAPEEYRTTERYVAYLDGFARNGYVVFKSDYRGHDKSEGAPTGVYWSNGYTTDVLNALASIKAYKDVNPQKIGMWGHSMGGYITLRSMVVSKDVKAGVIWGGVVASHVDLLRNWRRSVPFVPSARVSGTISSTRQQFIDKYGQPEDNPDVWSSISPINYVSDLTSPIQLHHGLADETVPWEFSEKLKLAMEKAAKSVEYFTYEDADHNLSGSAFGPAMDRSIKFFDTYLKS